MGRSVPLDRSSDRRLDRRMIGIIMTGRFRIDEVDRGRLQCKRSARESLGARRPRQRAQRNLLLTAYVSGRVGASAPDFGGNARCSRGAGSTATIAPGGLHREEVGARGCRVVSNVFGARSRCIGDSIVFN
jgi:hypothetical protein